MKRTLLIPLFILMFASTGWCYSIVGGVYNGVSVGDIDEFIEDTNSLANSNPITETDWVNSVLAPETVTFVVKDEPPNGVPYYLTDAPVAGDVFAFYMAPPASEYYLIKNSGWWALFRNLDEMDWGVFDTSELDNDMKLPTSPYTISHVTRFGGEPVPEPGTLLLLGAGLAGLAVYRRRIKK